MWATVILFTGVGVLCLSWYFHLADTAIAAGIIGAALNKYTNKNSQQSPAIPVDPTLVVEKN